eukprot:TRINITY_DN4274_c0_g1_i1.p1 TRINITY_DN4274_c0_g1~~TRINITY_DN4274_c0_g1_i1.p1  ORF type:complete len:240 (+),score=31.98 TRINITY_DN4274_c0_g1_i1:362-1081(+)
MVNVLNAMMYGVGGLVCTFVTLLVVFQEKLVYVPVVPGMTKKYPITPARLRLIYEDVWLTSSDGVRLHSWFIRILPDWRGPTILFFQENAGNIAHRLEYINIFLHRLKCNVFMLSYRGYGESDGYPSQAGIMKDAQAALDHLHQRTDIDTNQIIVFGRSLGGAVGASLCKNNPDKEQKIKKTSGRQSALISYPFLSAVTKVFHILHFIKLDAVRKEDKVYKRNLGEERADAEYCVLTII